MSRAGTSTALPVATTAVRSHSRYHASLLSQRSRADSKLTASDLGAGKKITGPVVTGKGGHKFKSNTCRHMFENYEDVDGRKGGALVRKPN
eukprot:SAG25_NODE_50_length_18801_cov_117.737729_5_plen_91_part_00